MYFQYQLENSVWRWIKDHMFQSFFIFFNEYQIIGFIFLIQKQKHRVARVKTSRRCDQCQERKIRVCIIQVRFVIICAAHIED